MLGESREVVPHWSAKITSLDFSSESSVCWIPLQDDFQRVGIYGKQKKLLQSICSFADDLSKQSQPVSTRRRRWRTQGRCYAFNQAFLHYPCNRTAYNISMSKKELAWQLQQYGNYVRDAWTREVHPENESSGGFDKKTLVDSLEALLRSLRGHIPFSEKTSMLHWPS